MAQGNGSLQALDTASAAEHYAISNVARTALGNLKDQHDWTELEVYNDRGHPRPLIRGLPPKRLYLHPDDQIAALAHERNKADKLLQEPEHEWVLAVNLAEKWSLARFAAVFDSIPHEPPRRAKRLVLASVHSDSTVAYYLIHEGIVKPRQN